MRTTALAAALLFSCASSRSAPLQFEAATAPTAPPALVDDYFTRDRSGAIGEAELKEVLAAPVVLEAGARVGVVPVSSGFAPTDRVPREGVAASLAAALEETGLVELATEIAPDWPADRGLPGLRELAARYRCDYLLLYRHRVESSRFPNGWAALYATVVGLLFVPGVSHEAHGVLEASLFDVKTGTVIFTAHERVHGQDISTAPGGARTGELLERRLVEQAAPKLAEAVRERFRRLAALRSGSPPVQVSAAEGR